MKQNNTHKDTNPLKDICEEKQLGLKVFLA